MSHISENSESDRDSEEDGEIKRPFAYTADTSLGSYVPKEGKNVVLMSTLHGDGRICDQELHKPEIIMDYNATKVGVDNMDKVVAAYSCKRRTLRWPLVIFFDMLDISVYNAFVIWMALNPEWKQVKLQKRRGSGKGIGL